MGDNTTDTTSDISGKGTSQAPHHIAIVMDGNGRWAKRRFLPRSAGHKKGTDSARLVTRHAGEIGVKWLTLFGFSTENWNRPEDEISELMGFLRHYLRSESAELHQNNVRLRVVGFRNRLDPDIVSMIEETENLTAENTGLNLTLALDYGGRQDIVQMTRKIVEMGISADKIDEAMVQKTLLTGDLPDPDLVIRSSGELRISNFLLWSSAYSEFYFTDTLWPDFAEADLDKAVADFYKRERRFGQTSDQMQQASS